MAISTACSATFSSFFQCLSQGTGGEDWGIEDFENGHFPLVFPFFFLSIFFFLFLFLSSSSPNGDFDDLSKEELKAKAVIDQVRDERTRQARQIVHYRMPVKILHINSLLKVRPPFLPSPAIISLGHGFNGCNVGFSVTPNT